MFKKTQPKYRELITSEIWILSGEKPWYKTKNNSEFCYKSFQRYELDINWRTYRLWRSSPAEGWECRRTLRIMILPMTGNVKYLISKLELGIYLHITYTHRYWGLEDLQNGLSKHPLLYPASISPDPQMHRKLLVVNLLPLSTPQGTPPDRKQE